MHHHLRTLLAILTSVLLAATHVGAQEAEVTQDDIAEAERRAVQYFEALRSDGLAAAAEFTHPEHLDQFKATLLPLLELFVQQGSGRYLIKMAFGEDLSLVDLRNMSSKEFMATLMGLMDAQAEGGVRFDSFHVIGSIPEADMIHVLTRSKTGAAGLQLEEVELTTFHRHGDEWLVGLAGELTGLVQAMRAQTDITSPAADDVSLADGQNASSGLDLRIEPFTDFYFLVRAQAAGVVPAEPYLQPVIDAWMPVQEEIGTFGGFWRFDLAGMLSSSPEEFRSWFDDMPESVPSRAGGTIPIQGPGLAMAEAMESAWPTFRDEAWPERRRQLEEIRARLEREFMPKHREALAYMLRSLGIADPEIDVPTYLALDIHPPGATTYRASDGPVFVASTRELLSEGRFSDLEETLLHEVSHCLDLATEGDDDVFSLMRALLEERGVTRDDRRYHDLPHLVMFVQAEETMKRLYDPEHVAYGDTRRGEIAPLYERSGESAVIVRRVWRRYLDGEFDLQEAVRRIVDDVL